jgi:RNA polymerase sigma-70 factor (sigma-E family)
LGTFEAFVHRSYAGLVRTAYLLTGDRGYAEDLVQQCLLTTHGSWDRLEASDKAMAYTRTSMVRLALKWRTRRWRGEVPTARLPEPAESDHAPDVDQAVLVRRALATLPPAQRAVLVLRYFDDRPEAEIAAMLRCSAGTVKSRAKRALAALRTQGLLLANDIAPQGGSSAISESVHTTRGGRPARRQS